MFDRLNQTIVRWSHSGWIFFGVIAGFIITLYLLLLIGERFPDFSEGAVPFDLQNQLTVAQIFSQLAGYADQAFTLYFAFQFVDLFFPLFAGLMLAMIWAFVLRNTMPRWYYIAVQRNLFLLLLVGTLFDWTENLTLLAVTIAYPSELTAAATIAVVAKKFKLAATIIAQVLTGLVIVGGAIMYVVRKLREP